jgi:tetratricopeptide (TPR) repeat protein
MPDVWTRAAWGRSSAWMGPSLPDAPPDVEVVTVACAGPDVAFGPFLEACAALGAPAPLAAAAEPVGADGLRARLRRRLLGDVAATRPADVIAHALNAAADGRSRTLVLVIEALTRVDGASLDVLEAALTHPGWLRVPLVLRFDAEPTGGRLASLLAHLVAADGPRAVMQPGSTPPSPTPRPPAPQQAARPTEVPPAVRLSLRALAAAGGRAEVAALAELLGTDPAVILADAQVAADAGVPIVDEGGGTLRIPDALAASLRASTLPSLAELWAARLAAPPSAPQPAAPVTWGAPPSAAVADPIVSEVRRRLDRASAEAARGGLDAAMTAVRQALDLARRADEPLGHRLEAEALLHAANLQWHAAGRGGGYTLRDALRAAEKAQSRLTPDDPPALVVEAARVCAGIGYDLGDAASLQAALTTLTHAIERVRRAAGDDPVAARQAASLLNDQAAIWLALGERDRATALLERSRALFEGRSDPESQREAAETDLLMARLVLDDERADASAYDQGLHHAARAEQVYHALGDARALGRVYDTAGRLHVRRGDLTSAERTLTRAAEVARQAGDALGLARTVEALAEVSGRAGRVDEALRLLGRALELDVASGSSSGVASARAALDRLRAAVRAPDAERLAELDAAISQAERALGAHARR